MLEKMENISVMSYKHLGSVNIIVLGYSNKKVHLINLKQIKCYCATLKKRQNNAVFDYIPN